MSGGSPTRELAERIVRSEPLKEAKVAEAVRAAMLDWLASAMAAASDPGAAMLLSALGIGAEGRGAGASSILGFRYRASATDAALVNGYLSHALDYDDVHESVRGHPSAVLLSALLAEAEERGSSGAELIAAYAVGAETMCRLGLALGSRHYEAGWHSTSTLGTLGAAAACARLTGLDVEATIRALGLAATQSGGLRVHFGSAVKPLHAGMAARAGLFAARLAATGFAGAEEPLAGPIGFLSLFGGEGTSPERVVEAWGQPWQIVEPGLWFKPYPCCSAAHHAADAALAIRSESGFAAEKVVRAEVVFPPGGDAALVVREPKTGAEGRFSAEYVVAAALADGELGIDAFSDRPIRGDLARLAAKVSRRYDAELAPAPNAMPKGRFAVLTVELADGTTRTERVDCPRGSPGRPLSAEERIAKFSDASREFPAAWRELPDRISLLETIENLSDFIPDI
ncbi:MAG: protein involved in propionate catabolism [Paenibacillus sp.]|nr:protein involved in propionate catabolism [Paenibacillus sp.]